MLALAVGFVVLAAQHVADGFARTGRVSPEHAADHVRQTGRGAADARQARRGRSHDTRRDLGRGLDGAGTDLAATPCISPVTLAPMKLTAGMTRRGLKQHMNNVAKPMRVGKNDEEKFVSLFATLSSALPTMRINADNGLTSITPATASTHFKAAGRVVLQPDIMIGSGATAARRTRLSNLAASMPDNARDAIHTRT